MAVSIPREIYTLGAVGLDTSRLANLEGQILAKREAKRLAEQEAIDRYMMELGGKLTPTGVRTSDLPGFEARRKAWMDFGLKNKSKLKTDPLVRSEFDRLFNNTLSYTQASKNEEEKAKTAKTMLADPTKRQQLNTEALMADISLHDLPLDDPSRKSIDYNAAWYKPATFDFTKEFTEASKGQPKSFLRVVPGSRNTTLGTVATEEGWTPKSINAIADNFVRSVRDNPDKYEYYVRRAKTLTPAELTDLNKELVGIGIVADDDDPLAVAYADALRQARSAIDVIQKPDTELAQSRGLQRAAAARAAAVFEPTGNVIDNFPDTPLSTTKGKPVGSIQDGLVYDNNGNFYTGEFRAAYEQLPADLPAILKFANVKLNRFNPFTVEAKDGRIIGLKQDGSPRIGRQLIENAQKKFGKKGMEFGPQGQTSINPDDPLGILD